MRNVNDKLIDQIVSLSKNTMGAFLLQFLSLTYPFVADCVSGFRSALVIHISDELEMMNVIKIIRGYGIPPVRLLGDSPKKFEQALQVPEYGVLVFEYSLSRYTAQNMDELISFCHRVVLDGEEIQPLVLILTDRPMPKHIEERFAGTVYLRELPTTTFADGVNDFARHLIEAAIDSQKLICGRIHRAAVDRGADMSVFQAASICIKTVVECWGADEPQLLKVSAMLDEAMDDIRQHWEPTDDPAFFVEVFRQLFVEWIETIKDKEILMFERNHVEGWRPEFKDTAMFYDPGYYYLPLSLFREICGPAAKDLGFTHFRSQLILSGLLQCEGLERRYYTVKVEVVTAFGEISRLHRVKISRCMLDEGEDFSILDLIMSKGGECDYGEDWHNSNIKQDSIYLGECK